MTVYNQSKAATAIKDFLNAVGEDTTRHGLSGTPDRVSRAWREMLQGYWQDPAEILKTHAGEQGFTGIGYEGMVVLSDYPFSSICEHHLLPFRGRADVGYLPSAEDGTVVGLSKLGRLVDLYAKRLQVQERLTTQIATALQDHLNPRGVAVRIRGIHFCMACRGVGKGGTMATEVALGQMKNHHHRSEFHHLCQPLQRGQG